jgi:hypothetical protein
MPRLKKLNILRSKLVIYANSQIYRNLAKAEKFYRIAIKNGERLESAIKDLATVLHQQGKTDEACKFLEDHRHLCKRNRAKYDNLLLNLRKQV